jgi:dihydroflavonol-4-reductase
MKTKALVTGATGFLGAWLVRRLLDEGVDVRIIKRPKSDLEELTGLSIETRPGDVTDLASLKEAMQGVDTVFHLAGLIAYSRGQRAAMERVNVQGTANVIEACRATGVRRLLHLSSVVAIGASFDGKVPLNEESKYGIHHLNLGYFETKHKAEKLVKDAVDADLIDAVMINPSTIYGPGDAKKGSRGVQLKVAKGKFPVYPPGGVNVVSVEDVIDCIIAAWKTGHKGERYIVSGENLLIKETFDIIAKLAGVKPPSIALPRPAIFAIGKVGDLLELIGQKAPLNTENAWTSVLYHWFDSTKAQRELGLKPKPATYAIEQSVRWIKDHGLA